MRLGILAGNRRLPLLLAQSIKSNLVDSHITAICFKGETDRSISKYVDMIHWVVPGSLGTLKSVMKREGLKNWIMAGQISPIRIFNRSKWDSEFMSVVNKISDFRPHAIFGGVIKYLEAEGMVFGDSITYLKGHLALARDMNNVEIDDGKDISFGFSIVKKYVELDVGQTVVVKSGSVVALESLEGTDRTIARGVKLAGSGCTVLKFCCRNQDLRFDVPVVGMQTLRLLKRLKVKTLVLQAGRVIIIDKKEFLDSADKWGIKVVGYDI